MHRADVDRRLVEIVDACLDLDPQARPASLFELAGALAQLAAPEPAAAFLGHAAREVDRELCEHELACWREAAALATRAAPSPSSPGANLPAAADLAGMLAAALPEAIDYY